MERNEGGATIGTLFQHIVNDMKVSGPVLWIALIFHTLVLSKQKVKIYLWSDVKSSKFLNISFALH